MTNDLTEINIHDFTVKKGDTFEPNPIELQETDDIGNVISDFSLEGYEGRMQVKDASDVVMYTLATESGEGVLENSMVFTDNQIQLFIQNIGIDIGEYYYDLQIRKTIDGNVINKTVIGGKFTVNKEITVWE